MTTSGHTPPHRLITIAPSHYCEKARWALRLAGMDYKEEPHLPFFHVRAVKKAGGTRSTPVLQTSAETIADSSEILAWLQSHPDSAWRPYGDDPERADAIDAWERRISRKLGDCTRRVAYYSLLPNGGLAKEILGARVPSRERRWLPLLFPFMRKAMRSLMRIDEPNASRSFEVTQALFDEVEARLREGEPGGHLFGEFSAADLTFATLAAPVLLPKGYIPALPELQSLPEATQTQWMALQERPAGQFGLRVYEQLEQWWQTKEWDVFRTG